MNQVYDFDPDEQQYAIRPNKSEIKRENAALEDLGMELINCPDERLNKLDLDSALLEAVKLARSIERHHGAFKRQRKFIAKMLRDVDSASIRAQLEGHKQQNALETYQTHLVERWRKRLLSGSDQDINALVAEHTNADRQKLRQLVRDARKEFQAEVPPRSSRLLFKYLRELLTPDAEDEDEIMES